MQCTSVTFYSLSFKCAAFFDFFAIYTFLWHKGDCTVQFSCTCTMTIKTFHSMRFWPVVKSVTNWRALHFNILQIHQRSKKAVLTDWGLANTRVTVMPRQGNKITTQAVGPTGGTYLYMVPEYSLHFEEASWQTDVVSWRDISGALHRIFSMDGKETTKSGCTNGCQNTTTCTCTSEWEVQFSSWIGQLWPPSSPPASDVQILKAGLDLASQYGYKW